MDKKKQENTEKCSRCVFLFFDGQYYRCDLFDKVIIQDIEEKNCES